MKAIIKKVFPILVLGAWPVAVLQAQQNAQFTQYMFNGIVINPAYAGTDEALKITLINRSQWVSFDGAPVTQGIYAHNLLQKQRMGLGLSFVNDKIGVHRNQNLRAMMAYHLPVSREATLSFGMQAGLAMTRSNYASLNTGNATMDPQLAGLGVSKSSLAMGMGIYFHSKKFHLGLSIPDLIPQTASINDTLSIQWKRTNYFLFSKYSIVINEGLRLEPGMLLKYYPGMPLSFDLNACVVIKEALTLGLAYRKAESIGLLLRAQLTPQLQFGYSYDHVTGEVVNASRGTHELSVGYRFRYSHDNVDSPR